MGVESYIESCGLNHDEDGMKNWIHIEEKHTFSAL